MYGTYTDLCYNSGSPVHWRPISAKTFRLLSFPLGVKGASNRELVVLWETIDNKVSSSGWAGNVLKPASNACISCSIPSSTFSFEGETKSLHYRYQTKYSQNGSNKCTRAQNNARLTNWRSILHTRMEDNTNPNRLSHNGPAYHQKTQNVLPPPHNLENHHPLHPHPVYQV